MTLADELRRLADDFEMVTFAPEMISRGAHSIRQAASHIETLEAALAATTEALTMAHVRIESLYDAIAHGDEAHRSWLAAKINEHFSHTMSLPAFAAMAKRREATEKVIATLRAYVNWTALPTADLGEKLVKALQEREALDK